MASVANVLAGKPVSAGGGVQYADLDTELPTDATSAVTGFTEGGFISEDGLTEATERDTDKVKAWGGDTVKVLQTDYSATFSWTFIESASADVLKAVYGPDNVVDDAGDIAVTAKSDQLPHMAWVFDVKDGDKRIRICVPDGQITETGEVTYSDGEVIGYEVTVESFYNEDLGGYYVKYIGDVSSGS